jgi:hypothetical protein
LANIRCLASFSDSTSQKASRRKQITTTEIPVLSIGNQLRLSFLSLASSDTTRRDRVMPAPSQRMTTANSLERQNASGQSAMTTYRLGGILRTRGGKTATAAAAE